MVLGNNTSGHLFDTTFNADGVLYADASGVITSTTSGSATQVLTSNGPGVAPSFQAAGGGSATVLSVAMTTNASMAQNALSDIIYDTVLVDTASGYSGGTYTVPSTGNWLVTIASQFASTAGFIDCDLFLNKNTGTYVYHGVPFVTLDDPVRASINTSFIIPLTAGDTIKISIFAQTTGATAYTALGAANGFYNILSMTKL